MVCCERILDPRQAKLTLPIAPYLSSKKKNDFPEEPAFEDADEYKHTLPPVTSGPDLKIRIPPELMPDDQTAMQYFDLYFNNVHPYVPVLNKAQFYQQWHSNRESISPLILEAIFAIAGHLADEPSQGQQWLALVGSKFKHPMVSDINSSSSFRACRFLYGCTTSKYHSGHAHSIESTRICTQKRLLLSILDDYRSVRCYGQRSWP
jgi:hypothetical protein